MKEREEKKKIEILGGAGTKAKEATYGANERYNTEQVNAQAGGCSADEQRLTCYPLRWRGKSNNKERKQQENKRAGQRDQAQQVNARISACLPTICLIPAELRLESGIDGTMRTAFSSVDQSLPSPLAWMDEAAIFTR